MEQVGSSEELQGDALQKSTITYTLFAVHRRYFENRFGSAAWFAFDTTHISLPYPERQGVILSQGITVLRVIQEDLFHWQASSYNRSNQKLHFGRQYYAMGKS